MRVLLLDLFITIAGVFLISSCSDVETTEARTKINWDGSTVKIEGVLLDVGFPLADIRTLQFYNQHIIFTELSAHDSILAAVNVNNPNTRSFLFERGDGPVQLESIDYLSIHTSKLQLYDPNKSILGQYKLQTTDSRVIIELTNRLKIKSLFADNVFQCGDEVVATYLSGDTIARLAILDSNGSVARFTGNFPRLPKTHRVDTLLYPLIYQAEVAVHPAKDLFSLTYKYEDLIEIYNSKGKILHSIKGPDNFFPMFKRRQRAGGGISKSPVRGKTRKGYITVKSTEDYIYALYSGKIMYPEDRSKGKSYRASSIFILDWNGNYVSNLKLSPTIYNFVIDPEKNMLYGVSDKEDTRFYSFSIL